MKFSSKKTVSMSPRAGKIFTMVFLIVFGAVFAVGGIVFGVTVRKYESMGVLTQAEILSITHRGDDETDVYVEFFVDGNRYSGELGYYSSFMEEGDLVEIYYMPDDPDDYMCTASGRTVSTVFFLIGFAISLSGIIMAVVNAAKASRVKRLKNFGTATVCTVREFAVKTNVTVMNNNPVHLTCTDAYGVTYKGKILLPVGSTPSVGDEVTFFVDRYKKDYIIDTKSYTPLSKGDGTEDIAEMFTSGTSGSGINGDLGD